MSLFVHKVIDNFRHKLESSCFFFSIISSKLCVTSIYIKTQVSNLLFQIYLLRREDRLFQLNGKRSEENNGRKHM